MRGLLLLAVGAAACTTSDEQRAPFGAMTLAYGITETTTTGTSAFALRASLTPEAEGFRLVLDGPRATPPISLDRRLEPAGRIIEPYAIAHLWLDLASRRAGGELPCGRVRRHVKLPRERTWEVVGTCLDMVGARYYDASTGLLYAYEVMHGHRRTSAHRVE